MNHHDLFYDPPTYGGTPAQEGHKEQIQIFGMENPDRQWILSGWDVWERNPYYHGPEQQHPEDDTPSELWEPYTPPEQLPPPPAEIVLDDCPF